MTTHDMVFVLAHKKIPHTVDENFSFRLLVDNNYTRNKSPDLLLDFIFINYILTNRSNKSIKAPTPTSDQISYRKIWGRLRSQ